MSLRIEDLAEADFSDVAAGTGKRILPTKTKSPMRKRIGLVCWI